MKSGLISILYLIYLFFPSTVNAQGTLTGDCACGSHTEGTFPNQSEVCNVGCTTETYCTGTVNIIGECYSIVTYNECTGPAQCPGSCCNGGQCGLCQGACQVGETWNSIGSGTGADAQGMCCATGTTATQNGTYEVTGLLSPDANPTLSQACGPYIFPLSTQTLATDVNEWAENLVRYTCPSYSCTGSCIATAPTNLTATGTSGGHLTINWTPGQKGNQQLIRIGEDLAEVNTGCYGYNSSSSFYIPCLESYAFPRYTHPNPWPSGVKWAFKLKELTCGFTSSYSDRALCETNLGLYIRDPYRVPPLVSGPINSTGICYNSQAECITYNSSTYTSTATLASGKNYYVRVANVEYDSAGSFVCQKDSVVSLTTLPPSCTVTLPVPSSTIVGSTVSMPATVSNILNGTVSSIIYSSTNTGVATINSSGVATGVSAGTSTIKADVYMGGIKACWTTRDITITAPYATPWWQVKDGDITTGGNLSSLVPTGGATQYFDTIGSGGFPGIPVYNGSFNLTASPTKISTNQWNAGTATTSSRLFNYSFFSNLIPEDVISGEIYSDGYRWNIISGDYNIPASDFGSNKEIYFIDGNLTISGNINVTDNLGFVAFFVSGNISVNPTISGSPAIEGIYISNGTFSTGAGTSQLHLRGSVAALGGVSLQRDLADDTNPAELFEYAPDQILLFPDKLGFRGQRWIEVAP